MIDVHSCCQSWGVEVKLFTHFSGCDAVTRESSKDGGQFSRAKWLLSLVLCCACIGCGASEDPAAYKRLKGKNIMVMQNAGETYQIIMSDVPFTDEVAADIAKLGHLKNLNFKGSDVTDETFKKAASGLDPISVILSDTEVTDDAMNAMSGYGRIEAIFLTNTGITDEGLKPIGKLGSITELNLEGTKISSEGLKHLTGMSKLKRLVLNNTAIDDAGLENLKSLSDLSKIDAVDTQITQAGIKAIRDAIPGLAIEQ